MASNLAIKLELGAPVMFTVGIALKSVEDRIKQNTKVLENIVAEVLRLGNEAKPAPRREVSEVGVLRPYLQATLNLLQQQLVALRLQHQVPVTVGQTGTPKKAPTPERDNLKVFEGLPLIGQAVTMGRALVLPAQISAQYQKITRDIAISAGVADGVAPSQQEQKVIGTVSAINDATGMERNQAATLIKQLYDTGMGLDQALAYAPVAAKFSVGQEASTDDTVRLIGELQSNPKITGPAELEKALEYTVFQRKGTGEGVADSLSAAQNQGLDQALGSVQPEGAKGVLDRDLVSRRGTSDRRLSEASDAVDDSLRSLGDSIRPLTDELAMGITATAKAFTGAPDAIKWLITGVTLLGTAFLALKGRGGFKSTPIPEGAGNGPGQGAGLSKVSVLNDPLNVFVVNASDIGCCMGAQGRERKRPSRSGRKTPQSRTPQCQSSSSARRRRSRSAPVPPPSAPPSKPPTPNRSVSIAGRIGAAIKEVRSPALLEAGIKTVATFATADTPEEKAEGYGAAAGGLVGSMLGGVLGAFVPVIGTPIGALLGGMAGEAFGGWLGKKMVASREEPAPAVAQPGDVVRSLVSAVPVPDPLATLNQAPGPQPGQPQQVSQQFTFTPSMPITVQGSVSDPMLLAQNLQAMVRREFEELMRMATARQLSDIPHVN
ncbi:hypothetical protein [Pseudomonas putida]|uniref:hypothetical protein n=1 Tax=Pseudomonas putida TaxID=303 RepID=UPI002365ABC2|nr:hypothetical protein [Pseudomonas putida]MDD2047326.1 hypothetical protein [Pseudomonas putida]